MHVLEEGISSGAARELVAAGQHRQQGRGEGGAVANVLGDCGGLALVCVEQRALDEWHLVRAKLRLRLNSAHGQG